MTRNIYRQVPLRGISLMQRLLKQYPQENAVIALNNLLAATPVKDISIQDVADIENRYSINLLQEFRLNMEEFYAVYLNDCLSDHELSNSERAELAHLKLILNLDDHTVAQLHNRLGEPIFRQAFHDAIAGGRLTPERTSYLDRLEQTLGLSKKLTEQISAETRMAYIKNYIAQVIADERFSPTEERELQAITQSLNVNLQLNQKTKEQLQLLKTYWALEHLPLPIIQPDIALQRAEVCHMRIAQVNWHELRSERVRTNYGGYSTRIRVAKGFYLHSGSTTRRSYSVDVMKLIDSGTLYLTNKRIIFAGSRKNSNIQLSKIIELTPYSNGVRIGKDTGKSPTLQISSQVDIFCLMLERLLNER